MENRQKNLAIIVILLLILLGIVWGIRHWMTSSQQPMTNPNPNPNPTTTQQPGAMEPLKVAPAPTKQSLNGTVKSVTGTSFILTVGTKDYTVTTDKATISTWTMPAPDASGTPAKALVKKNLTAGDLKAGKTVTVSADVDGDIAGKSAFAAGEVVVQ